jgi:hypothetical protein
LDGDFGFFVSDAPEQIAVGDARRSEVAVVATNEIVSGEDCGRVMACIDCFGVFIVGCWGKSAGFKSEVAVDCSGVELCGLGHAGSCGVLRH